MDVKFSDSVDANKETLEARILEVGAFVEHDGDVSIVLDGGAVVCLNRTPFIHTTSLSRLVASGIAARPVRRGETLTITF